MSKDTRFQKGRSGNPNGRPKGKMSSSVLTSEAHRRTLEQAEQLITIREGGTVSKVPVIEAIFKAQNRAALSGSPLAQKHAIERYEKAEKARRQEIDEEIAWATDYAEKAYGVFADAKRRGLPPPELPLHPDDILIDPREGVKILGPTDDEGTAALRKVVRLCDVLLMQDALDRRGPDLESEGELDDQTSSAWLFAIFINQRLPKRFCLSDTEIVLKAMRYSSTPKRELLKTLYRSWHMLGIAMPRGRRFPSMAVALQQIDICADAIAKHG